MTEGQLASLYTSCHCLVAPYRGEGFGLPILEAMACGLAPIVPKGGASDDFVDETTGYLLDAREVESIHEWRLRGVPTELSTDVADLRATMRHAFEEREETKARGVRASKATLAHFTWQNTARRMTERIRELAQQSVPIRQKPRVTKPPSLSLCVILRNDERALADCLGRLRPFVDEIVAVDIGSDDRSKAIAAEYGARVYRDEWKDSFGHARNLAVVRATSDWILSLDPWDQIDDPPARSMGQMLAGLDRDVLGVNLRVFDGELAEWQTRLFRNQNEILFDLRAGETVQSSIRRMGGKIVDFDIIVRRAVASTDLRLDERIRLAHLDLLDDSGNPDGLLTLGKCHFLSGNFFHAECYLHEYLAVASDHASRQFASLLLILSHRRKGDLYRAMEAAEAATEQYPDDVQLQQQLASIRRAFGGQQ